MTTASLDFHPAPPFARNSKNTILRCTCRENIFFSEGEELILKSRIVKIVKGVVWAKCKRCDQWLVLPLRLHSA